MLFCIHVGKNAWPELVGKKSKVAEKIVEKENNYVDAVVVPEGSVVTADFRCDRVRIWVDQNYIVTRVPIIG